MRKIEIAEAILSLAAGRERAAATAGDLFEESRGSALRFWWLVSQTSILQTGRQLAKAPFGMVGAAARALVIELGFFLFFSTLPATAGMIRAIRPWLLPDGFVMGLGMVVTMVVVIQSVAGAITRRYPGREGTVILIWMILRSILCIPILVCDARAIGMPPHSTMNIQVLLGVHWFLYYAPMSLIGIGSGVVVERRISRRRIARA